MQEFRIFCYTLFSAESLLKAAVDIGELLLLLLLVRVVATSHGDGLRPRTTGRRTRAHTNPEHLLEGFADGNITVRGRERMGCALGEAERNQRWDSHLQLRHLINAAAFPGLELKV